ncbi:hypothetical protein BKA65DRAFT_417761, partial [Rhexocercosporidium sp. MPI-PUGE-AT-0058]
MAWALTRQAIARSDSHDGLRYFWVDTCCIDKSNNTELAETINSKFRCYQHAAKCYLLWELAFRESRWSTQGWTLQDLIAPKSVAG